MEEGGENLRKKEAFTGHKPIEIDVLIAMRRSICKIIVDNKGKIKFGTGFFMKVSDSKRYLITNYHIIDIDSLKEKIEIEIWNKKKYILNPNNFDIKYLKEPKDIMTLEFKDLDDIFLDVDFLNYDRNYEDGYLIYKDADIFTIEHPLGKNASCSSGKILNIYEYEFDHNISTEPGSSGCPILLLSDNTNLIKVIGIHKNGDKKNKINGGTFIGEIIKEIEYDSNKFMDNNIKKIGIKENNNFIIAEIYIDYNNINKDIRIINSFKEILRKNFPIFDIILDKKEIKECNIEINGKLIPFNYFHNFKEQGKYMIKYSFKTYLNNACYLFGECKYLTILDLPNFDTSNVIDMRLMFNECYKLKEIKGIDKYITSKVTNMRAMFQECNELQYLDLSNFDTSNVIDM